MIVHIMPDGIGTLSNKKAKFLCGIRPSSKADYDPGFDGWNPLSSYVERPNAYPYCPKCAAVADGKAGPVSEAQVRRIVRQEIRAFFKEVSK